MLNRKSLNRKKSITIKLYIFNSSFNWQFWFFWTKLTLKSCFQSKKKKRNKQTNKQNHNPILHIQISVSSKFQLQQTILIFWKNFSKKRYFWPKQEKNNITIEFFIFKLVQVSNFSLNWQICFLFLFCLPKKVILGLKKIKWKSPSNFAYLN